MQPPPRPPPPPPRAPRPHATPPTGESRLLAVRWWAVVLLGTAALGAALSQLAGTGQAAQGPVLATGAATLLAALLPMPRGLAWLAAAIAQVLVLLLLLMQGPEAATLAAALAGVGRVGSGGLRPADAGLARLLARPLGAAAAMGLAGTLFLAAWTGLGPLGAGAQALLLPLVLGAAVLHGVLGQLLTTGPAASGAGLADTARRHAAAAVLAGILSLVFQAAGVGVLAGALPLSGVLILVWLWAGRPAPPQHSPARPGTPGGEPRFQRAFSHAAIGMALVSVDGVVLQANLALCRLLGLDEADLVGRRFLAFVHPEDAVPLDGQWRALRAGERVDVAAEIRLQGADGEPVFVALHSGFFADRDPGASDLILQVQDMTARRLAEAKLHHMAYHDGLTSLANRIRFGHCLAQALQRCRLEPGYQFAVMYLDFDRFKLINDTLGHSAGDRFLTLVAQRVRAQMRPVDTVGRLGGDEFAILVDGLGDERTVKAMATRLQATLAAPYMLDGTEVTTTASIGITFSRVGYDAPGDVLRDADIAMYRAKAAGRGQVALFDAGLRAQLAARVDLERELDLALAQQQFALVFQPIFDLETGRVDSLEALVRWHHPTRGAVGPDEFITIAEDAALIGRLTDWVIAAACAQMRRFDDEQALLRPPHLHVNVSGADLCRADFVAQVAAALRSHRLAPAQLTLEVTEATLTQRRDGALEAMGRLRELGVGLSVDDFGTGSSSFAYVAALPITSLKIDRTLVQRLQDGAPEAEVVKAIVMLGHGLGKRVVAEGVETPQQLARLRALGCTLGQGYLMSRPLSAGRAAAALVAEQRWPASDARPSDFDRFVPTGFHDTLPTVH